MYILLNETKTVLKYEIHHYFPITNSYNDKVYIPPPAYGHFINVYNLLEAH